MLLLGERETVRAEESRGDRKSLRRELREQDRVSAKLAELHAVDSLLADASHIIERGWLQHGWFATSTRRARATPSRRTPVVPNARSTCGR